jgi:hypothetical protein
MMNHHVIVNHLANFNHIIVFLLGIQPLVSPLGTQSEMGASNI